MKQTKSIVLIITLVLMSGIQSLVYAESEQPATPKRFVIAEFTSNKMDKAFLQTLAENMRKELTGMGASVMSLKDMESALKDSVLPKDLTALDNVVTLGKLYGADKVIVGSIEVNDVIFTITSMLVDVESGKADQNIQEKLISDSAKLTQDVQKLAYRICKRLYQPVPASSSMHPGAGASPVTPGQPETTTMKPQTASPPTTPVDPGTEAAPGKAPDKPNAADSQEKKPE